MVERPLLPFAEGTISVHCFFNCGHVVQSVDPQEAHDLMERHYGQKHAHQIEQIVARLMGKRPTSGEKDTAPLEVTQQGGTTV